MGKQHSPASQPSVELLASVLDFDAKDFEKGLASGLLS